MEIKMIFLCLLIFMVKHEVNAKCSLTISPNSPILVNSNFQTYEIIEETIYFDNGESFYMECLEEDFSEQLDEFCVKALCIEDNKIKITRVNKEVDFNSVECEKKSGSPFKEYYHRDVDENEVRYVVYKNPFPPVVFLFNKFHLTPQCAIFSNDITNTHLNKFETPASDFSDFEGHFRGINMQDIFDKNYQKKIFQKLSISKYINNETYLVPSQLMPTSLINASMKYINATMDYINIFPIWNDLHSIWVHVINEFVRFAEEDESEINILTGTSFVAILPDEYGWPVQLYLNVLQIPVPRWIFVASYLKDLGDMVGPAILFYNNPYVDFDEVDEELDYICDRHVVLTESDRYEFFLGPRHTQFYVAACYLNDGTKIFDV